MKAYYEGPGADDPVRIDLAAGSYVPVIYPAPERVHAMPALPPPPAPSRIQTKRWRIAGAAVLAALRASVYFLRLEPSVGSHLTDLRRQTLESGVYGYTALAPDGRSIVYSTDRGSGKFLKLWKQPLDGGPPVQLTFGDYDDLNPAVSPDSAWIAFESKKGRGSIQLMPKEPVQLVREFDDAHEPVRTADGRHLLFCGPRRSRGGSASPATSAWPRR